MDAQRRTNIILPLGKEVGWRFALFGNDVVGPFHQRNKDRWAAPLCSPRGQICFRDPTGPGAGPSRKDGDVFRDDFFHHLAQRRPTDRLDGIRRRLAQ